MNGNNWQPRVPTLKDLYGHQKSKINKIVDWLVYLGHFSCMPRMSDMKERLTEAAMGLIWENSYGSTSVDAICERAGAKKGSFYYFFKSKSELAAAALEGDWKRRKADMDTIFSATVSPLDRFERYFDYVHDRLAEVQRKCGSILGCPLLSIGSEVSTQDELLREKIQEILERKIRYFESTIRDAHSQGLIVAPDAKAKAKGLFACYQGTLAQARIHNDLEPIREFKYLARDILGITQGVAAGKS